MSSASADPRKLNVNVQPNSRRRRRRFKGRNNCQSSLFKLRGLQLETELKVYVYFVKIPLANVCAILG